MLQETEQWRPVNGFPYEVSSLGQVYSVRTKRILRPFVRHRGYLAVRLSGERGEGTTNRSVHSLVAEAFIGPRPDGLVVNHKDGVNTNNRHENLEYVTCRENVRHAVRIGARTRPRVLRKPATTPEERAARQERRRLGLCVRGHRLDKLEGGRKRICNTCKLEQSRRSYRKRTEAGSRVDPR